MPTITNFGDVVTTGNTILQGNLLPITASSSNIGQSTQAFGSSWINSMNALSLNVTSANITTLNAASVNIATIYTTTVTGGTSVSAPTVVGVFF